MHTETMEHNTLHYYLCSHDFIYVYLLLVPAYPGCPGSKAVKRSLLLLLLLYISDFMSVADRIKVIYSFADIVHSL